MQMNQAQISHSFLGILLAAALALVLAMLSPSARAHGNDDHEHAAPVANQITVAPRASAQSEDFELVAVLQGARLVIYLDQFASNEAVNGAQIEVESKGLFKLLAKESEPGVYVIDLSSLGAKMPAAVGKYPLTFTIDAADTSDVLASTLEIAADDESLHDHAASAPTWQRWLALASVISAAVLVLLLWMRRRAGRTSLNFNSANSARLTNSTTGGVQ
ncbi:hypothetical protein RF679_05255 [Undibacterium cyanobacteriorum]|uniref:CopC domain-containing protein n=1 Tax=Undibacterium cyanobacteriorum TaxID=3073561 RepID=A0ABY9RMP0_9BURK|nr:hypothetical protein [Undibacterium sp. 20NA77.5]WMW81687.1 hypothetical protein RF679_05255 [Undibacterium sp. 20NA77.5]